MAFRQGACDDAGRAALQLERLGLEQARLLRERLEATINPLARAPLRGHRRGDLDPPGRSFRYFAVVKRFIFAYEPIEDGLRVVRILQGARKLAAEIAVDPGDEE